MAARSNALSELTRFWLEARHGCLVQESIPVPVPYGQSDIDFLAMHPRLLSITLPDGAQIGPRFIVETDTSNILYLFTAKGMGATVPVHQLPQVNDPAEGTAFNSLSALKPDDEVVATVALPLSLESGFLFFATAGGEVKRMKMEDLPGLMANAFSVMDIEKGDRLGWVMVTGGEEEVVLVTADAQAIRFKETDVRPTGMGAGGMRGVKLLGQRDRVVGAAIAGDHLHLWVVTDDGIAKLSPLDEYPTQGRAGSGVVTMKLVPDSRGLAAAAVGKPDDAIILLTSKNRPKYMRLSLAPKAKRAAKGDYIISLGAKEHVKSVATYQKRIDAPDVAEPEVAAEAPPLYSNGHSGNGKINGNGRVNGKAKS